MRKAKPRKYGSSCHPNIQKKRLKDKKKEKMFLKETQPCTVALAGHSTIQKAAAREWL